MEIARVGRFRCIDIGMSVDLAQREAKRVRRCSLPGSKAQTQLLKRTSTHPYQTRIGVLRLGPSNRTHSLTPT